MVGIVIVSHSARLAEGVAELAREMGGPEVALEVAGGLDLPERPMGTDAAIVMQAIERAWSDDGVLVLMDLGSAVLSAEMALDFIPPERRRGVLLCEAPLVEGAVAAAVTARLGASLAEVAAEARAGLRAKEAHLGSPAPAEEEAAPGAASEEAVTARLVVSNPLGLHARPAARLVQTASRFDAEVTLTNQTTGRGPAPARSLSAVATLGLLEGHEVLVAARGPQAAEALEAIGDLARRGFDDPRAAPPPRDELAPAAAASAPPSALHGVAASPGVAAGPARHLRAPAPEVPKHPAADPAAEWRALGAALDAVRGEVRRARASVAARAGEYEAAIFDAHLLMLEDEALLGPSRRMILEEGRNAGNAWQSAAEAEVAAYRALDDEYLRARGDDLADVSRRVLLHLLGGQTARPALAGAGILVAASISPGETAALDPAEVLGIATAFGGRTSHAAILARALGLPAVVGLAGAVLTLEEGTPLLLDGDTGVVHVRPDPALVEEHQARSRTREAARAAAVAAARQPAITRDGQRIEVAANLGGAGEVAGALDMGADGVGLLRTEFLFLEREHAPGEDEQYAAYRAVAEALGGSPLTLRTLDAGGDKPLPYLPQAPEDNPFLGVRGIRLSLLRPDLLRTQLRAAARVAADGFPLRVMFPMVAGLDELRRAVGVLEEAWSDVGVPVPRPEVGIMIEVPAAALTAPHLASEVDFFSVGTNDLSQYALAADRGNERVGPLADPLHPAVLQLVRHVTEAAAAAGKWVGVCGELAGDPLATPLLLGLGVTELSMAPPAIPLVKEAVRTVAMAPATELVHRALGLGSANEVRALLQDS